MSKKKAFIAAALVLALGALLAPGQQTNPQPGQAPPTPQKPAPQQPAAQPALLMQPMPDFTLPALDGGEVTLSALRGKNVLIVFFRGYAGENAWCTICHYQYAELVMRDLRDKVREKYNMDVLFILPYDKDVVTKWRDVVPDQLEKIKKWKNPDPAAADDAARRRAERSKRIFPLDMSRADIEAKPGELARPFPVLLDADRALTKRLGIFATEWGGSKVDQGIPSVFIVDKAGLLRFKYIGQNTVDRPSYDYLFEFLEFINARK